MSLRSFELYIHMTMDEDRDLGITLDSLDPLNFLSSSGPLVFAHSLFSREDE